MMSERDNAEGASASRALHVGQLQHGLGTLSLPQAFSGSVAELPDPSELAQSLYGSGTRAYPARNAGTAPARAPVAAQLSPRTAPPAQGHASTVRSYAGSSFVATSQVAVNRPSSEAAGAAPPVRPAPPLPSSLAPSVGVRCARTLQPDPHSAPVPIRDRAGGRWNALQSLAASSTAGPLTGSPSFPTPAASPRQLRASAAAAEEMLSRRIDDLQRQFHESRASDRMELRHAVDRLSSWVEDTIAVAPARSDIVGAAELRQLREENSSLRTSLEEMQDRVEHLELQMRDVGKLQAALDGDAMGRLERRMDEQEKQVKETRDSLRHTQHAAHGALRQVALRSESRWSRFADGLRALVPDGRDDDDASADSGGGSEASDGAERRRLRDQAVPSRRRLDHLHHPHGSAHVGETGGRSWGAGARSGRGDSGPAWPAAVSAGPGGQGAGTEPLNVSDLLAPPPARGRQDYDAVDALHAALGTIRASMARAEDAAAANGEKALAARDHALETRCGALEGRVEAMERRCEDSVRVASGGSEHLETLRKHASWVQDRIYALQASDASTARSVALLERRLNTHDASAELQSEELQGVKRRLMEGLRLIASLRGGGSSRASQA